MDGVPVIFQSADNKLDSSVTLKDVISFMDRSQPFILSKFQAHEVSNEELKNIFDSVKMNAMATTTEYFRPIRRLGADADHWDNTGRSEI